MPRSSPGRPYRAESTPVGISQAVGRAMAPSTGTGYEASLFPGGTNIVAFDFMTPSGHLTGEWPLSAPGTECSNIIEVMLGGVAPRWCSRPAMLGEAQRAKAAGGCWVRVAGRQGVA